MVSLIPAQVLNELQHAARLSPAHGLMIEVGVYQGGSAQMLGEIAHGRGQELWLFDTFEGMPQADDIDYHRIGEFADCSAEAVQALVPRAKIFQGVFPETWTALSRPLEKHIAFVHVDCDQYKSISDCINVLGPLMVKGGIMWFDDYGYPHLPGAQRAVDEHLPDRQTSPSGRAYYIFP